MLENNIYELTSSQKNIWDTELFFSNSNLNNIGGYVFIKDKVNFTLLEKALNLYAQKNDSLHLKLKLINGTPYQYIEDFSDISIDLVSLKDLDEVTEFNKKIVEKPFILFHSFLFSFTMFQLPDGTGGFNATLHHLISDAWNMSLLINEVMDFYSSLLKDEKIDDSKFPSYIDYIHSQESYISSSRYQKDEAFWHTLFDNEFDVCYISNKNKHELDTRAKRKIFKLSNDIYTKILDLCKTSNCSIYTFFMAIYSLYLSKINHATSPIIGTPVLNRSGVKEKRTSGMFISTIPFKVDINKTQPFSEFLKTVASMQMSIFKHQKYPYDKLLKYIKKKHNLTESPYDLVLSYQNARDERKSSDVHYYSKWIESGHTLDSLEVHFYDMDNTGTLDIFYDYQINKFNEEDISHTHSRILSMVDFVLQNPEIPLSNVEITDKEEKQLILKDFNHTNLDYDRNESILQVFRKQVEKNASSLALIFEDETYTYKALDVLSNKLANYLLSLNLPKNSVIGIMLNRSANTIISMLAILKANMTYMLIEKDLPSDRIQYMLTNAKSPLLFTAYDVNYLDFANTVYLDTLNWEELSSQEIPIQDKPTDSLSVVYTSGSTGLPKGVLIKRFSMINLVNGYKYSMHTNALSNFLSICSVAFDMFAAEVWIALLSGKKLILANEEQSKNPIPMSKLINKENCEFMLITSSKMDLLLSNTTTSACLKHLKAIQLGGEVLDPKFFDKVSQFTKAKIYNGYGPSETTSCCTCKYITDSQDINLGKPLPNVQIYICDEDLNLCPIGIVGELCIAGDGVSLGYINNPELTNKKFVKNPFGKGLLYKTGDLAKWTANGDIVYIGRNDFQIKIRGLRIELEEINNAIKALSGVHNSVTIVRKIHNIDTICSFVVSSIEDATQVKTALAKRLPHYMIPSHIVFMETLPLTVNGKIDTRKLPEITVDYTYTAPKTELEKNLASVYEEYLGIEKISVDSNFFELGGDSLIAIKIITKLSSDFDINLGIKDIFSYPTIASLSHYIEARSSENIAIPVSKAKVSDAYPLTSAQKRIFYTVQKKPSSLMYNTPGGILFDAVPNIKKLESSINQLIALHDALRTYFVIEDDDVKQKILPNYKMKLEVLDNEYSHLDTLFNEFLKPFDLHTAPLFRVQLVRLDNGKSILFTDFHHIICDGISIATFTDELCKLYNGKELSTEDFDYKDYTVYEENYFNSKLYQSDKDYWKSKFSSDIPVLNMPTTYPRPSTYSNTGNRVQSYILDIDKISTLCTQLNTTPYIFMLCVYYILLYKYTNQNEIIVGTPVANRTVKEFSHTLGMFVNTLALKNTIDATKSFKDFVSEITKHCLEDLEHQAYPFDKLVEDLDIPRDLSRNLLFDTMFVFQNEEKIELDFGKLHTDIYTPNTYTSKFDFMLEITPEKNFYRLNLEYSTKLYSEKFMQDFLKYYIQILDCITDNIDMKISDVSMLSDEEKDTILKTCYNQSLEYPKDMSIIELFEEQERKHPNAIALNDNGNTLTYKQLKDKVYQFSNFLIKKGIQKGDYVATLLNRSTNLIVAMLSIMKCGAVYLPISKNFPEYRIRYILEDSKATLLITDAYTLDLPIQTVHMNHIDLNTYSATDISVHTLPDDPIYSIYTSGTTGNPKGVIVMNKNLNNFIHSFNKLYSDSVSTNDICLASTSIAFDVSIWEFFFTLLNGATLYLYKYETIEDIFDFCNTLIEEKITMAYLPPNILNEVYVILSQSTKKTHLEKILIGVEPIKTSIIQKYFELNPSMKIVNGYGPTETTICSTAFQVTPSNCKKYNIIPIGKPLYNLHGYILDKDLNLVPNGIPGTFYIAGDNVSKGYLNKKTLTKEKYIPSPFHEDEIMYTTGDVVKRLPDGNISFIGRDDNQIKLNGHRIELSEISNCILNYPSITKCIVLVKESKNTKSLVAYFTAENNIIINDLRNFLSMKLPLYSIPNHFIQLEKFVLTANGKIDKKYLASVKIKENTNYEAPRNDFEKKLVDLWKDLLNIDKIGINDDFFELGGDSLIAIKLQIQAFKQGLDISYSDIFSHSTIKKLSEKIGVRDDDKAKLAIKSYDYSKIDEVLKINTLPILKTFRETNVKNVLLTGVTGFVGIHILEKLLNMTDATIYCLVRNKNNVSYIDRLYKIMQFYFGNKYHNLIGSRIKMVRGDITLKNLGIADEDFQKLTKNLSCVINSAAIVKHYGKSTEFDKININGVNNIIDFCSNLQIPLYHLSTLSVSGNVFSEGSFSGSSVEEKTTFRESNLYIKQDISNIYVYTKFMAEKRILEAIQKKKLQGTIIRLGNITNRYSDGKFQINISENAFLNRIITFIKLGAIPDYLLDGYCEFTPIDYVADAIVRIVKYNHPYTVLHVYNSNHIPMSKMISIFKQYGIAIDILPEDQFIEKVNQTLANNENDLSGIINDFDTNKKLIYDSNVILNNDFTNEFLTKLSFKWCTIDKTYLFKYLDYLKTLGLIGG